jgi:hypothetical protein
MKIEKIRDVYFPDSVELHNEDKFPLGSFLIGLKGKEYEKFHDDDKQRSAGKVIKIELSDNEDKVEQFRGYLKNYYTMVFGSTRGAEEGKRFDNDSYLRFRPIDITPQDGEIYSYAMDYHPPSGGGKTRKRKRKSYKRKSYKRKSHKHKSHKRKSHKRKSRRTRR